MGYRSLKNQIERVRCIEQRHGNDLVKSAANGFYPIHDKEIDRRPVAGMSASGNTIADYVKNGTIRIGPILKPTT